MITYIVDLNYKLPDILIRVFLNHTDTMAIQEKQKNVNFSLIISLLRRQDTLMERGKGSESTTRKYNCYKGAKTITKICTGSAGIFCENEADRWKGLLLLTVM